MNKTSIKNFAIWARNKLIADISYKAGLLGISEQGIKDALPQSTKDVQFFDIGMKEPYAISGIEINQREKLADTIRNKAKQSEYVTAYKRWWNRYHESINPTCAGGYLLCCIAQAGFKQRCCSWRSKHRRDNNEGGRACQYITGMLGQWC